VALKPHGRNDNTRWRNARRRTIARSGGACQLCGDPLAPQAPAKHPDATEVDHIVPLSQGGDPYSLDNLRAVHRRCHQKRETFTTIRTGWFHLGDRCDACPHSIRWTDDMEHRTA
jgi:5-methylcytosine-specific restriction endonuclease McrA